MPTFLTHGYATNVFRTFDLQCNHLTAGTGTKQFTNFDKDKVINHDLHSDYQGHDVDRNTIRDFDKSTLEQSTNDFLDCEWSWNSYFRTFAFYNYAIKVVVNNLWDKHASSYLTEDGYWFDFL